MHMFLDPEVLHQVSSLPFISKNMCRLPDQSFTVSVFSPVAVSRCWFQSLIPLSGANCIFALGVFAQGSQGSSGT